MTDRAAVARAVVDAEQRARTESRRRLAILRVEIASPCDAKWEEMAGDEKTRFCLACEKNVHDLTAMSAEEVSAFFDATAGTRTCVRVWQRRDGTMLREDCPLGIRRQRLRGVLLGGLSIAGVALGCFTGLALLEARSAHASQATVNDAPVSTHEPAREPALLTVFAPKGAVVLVDGTAIGEDITAFPISAKVRHEVKVVDPHTGFEGWQTISLAPGALGVVSLVPQVQTIAKGGPNASAGVEMGDAVGLLPVRPRVRR